MQNVEIGVVWGRVRGHPRSRAMSPLDRAHTTSYSTLIETTSILCRFCVIVSYLSKVAYFNLSHMHLALPLGDRVRISPRYLTSKN